MDAWQRESKVNRAKATAHYLNKTMRQAYIDEQSLSGSKGKGASDGGASYANLQHRMGLA